MKVIILHSRYSQLTSDLEDNAEAEIIEQLREECIKLSAEFIQKKEEYDRQQEEIRKEKERLEALEKAEAEAKAKEKGKKILKI